LDAHVVMEVLQAAGVAAGVVQRAPDTLADPQLKWLGSTVELDHPVSGKRLYPGVPFKMSGAQPVQSTAAPLLGQHTEEICRDLLKMSGEETQRLVKEDILHTPASSKGGGTSILG
jgi:benzylsuccinate CoA-transferase BbsF subunit